MVNALGGCLVGEADRLRCGKIVELLEDELDGVVDFQGAQFCPRINVAGIESQDGNGGIAINTAGKSARTSQAMSGRARGEADESGGAGLFRGTMPVSSIRAGGGGIEEQRLDVGKFCEHLAERSGGLLSIMTPSRSKRTPPGMIQPRPKRLPQIPAVRLMTAVRKAPNAAAGGRSRFGGDSAERGEMHGHAFQFQGDAAQRVTAQREQGAVEGLERGAIGGGMGDDGIAGD